MIVHINHVPRPARAPKPGAPPKKTVAELSSLVMGTLMELVQGGAVDPRQFSALRVHLDWLQYRHNFRHPVTVRRAVDPLGQPLPLAELAIDLRQADPERLSGALSEALERIRNPDGPNTRLYLGEFGPLRDSIIWKFNQFFWEHVGDWEASSGKGFEAALPGGKSTANEEAAVTDTVTEFWGVLKGLDESKQLPEEVFVLEIGVGSGEHAKLWMDACQRIDRDRGTDYYPRLRYVFGDYSMYTLERARDATGPHADKVQLVPMDALNPFDALPKLRFKVLHVHLTNVYDNLIFDELVRRDGRVYLVEARPYLSQSSLPELETDFGVTRDDIPRLVERMFEIGRDALPEGLPGTELWKRIWAALKLEERLRALDDMEEDHVPPGLSRSHIEDLLDEAPDDVRFHVSRGAAESFANTLPLLHPSGTLQVQDIFVADMEEYRQGFKGPGKLDGSLVVWVNGALLRAVGRRAGYDVHFVPYTYRPGSPTRVMYTTQRA